MSKVNEKIVNFLKGEFLLNEEGFKNWRMLVFIILLLMLMVRSGHKTDEKVMQIAVLSKQERELRAEYIAIRSKAMKLKLESNVVAKVAALDLKPSDKPAQVIKEVSNKK